MTTFESRERDAAVRSVVSDDADMTWPAPRCYQRSCLAELYGLRDEETGVCPACHAQWMSSMLNGDPELRF